MVLANQLIIMLWLCLLNLQIAALGAVGLLNPLKKNQKPNKTKPHQTQPNTIPTPQTKTQQLWQTLVTQSATE